MKSYGYRIRPFLIVGLALVLALLTGAPSARAIGLVGQLNKLDPELLRLLNTNPHGEFSVIAQTAVPGRGASADTVSRAHGAVQRLKANGAKRANSLAIIGAGAARLPATGILKLTLDPFISRITLDKEYRPLGTLGALSLYAQIVRAPKVWAQGITGQGVSVAILDSGISTVNDLTLPAARVIASVDLTGSPIAGDPGGHGTHVAGIVAGNGNDSSQGRAGIAPGTNLVSVRVINASGRTNLSTVVRAIQWVVQNRKTYNIRVMNLSLGAPTTSSYKSDPLAAAVEIAWHSGVVVVAAAGNDGPTSGAIVTPGIDPFIVTVGAIDDNNTFSLADDTIPFFSSRGPTPDGLTKPDLVAPGRKIVSLRSPNSYLDNFLFDRRTDTSYFRLTGTSMSAPVVAGTVALMLQNNPGLLPNQVKKVLSQTARPYLGISANSQGAGLVDAYAAVNSPALGNANAGRTPSDEFCKAVYPILYDAPLNGVWRNPNLNGINWQNITWDNITWDNIAWDNITWSNITWDNITWDNITWDSAGAASIDAESTGWESFGDLD